MKSIVIIVTYNSERYITRCVDSIVKNDKSVEKIFVWDNNSSDNTAMRLKTDCAQVAYFISNKNIGFARAVNKCIDQNPGYDWYILLNPDTEIGENSFSKLIDGIGNVKARIVGGVTRKYGSGIHHSSVRFPDAFIVAFEFTNLLKLLPNNYWHNRFYYLGEKLDSLARVDAVSGAFMGISSDIIKAGIRFDEKYFMYLEDIQFCKDALRFGFTTWFNPNSVVYHEGGASSNNRIRVNYEAWVISRAHYVNRNFAGTKKHILKILITIDRIIVWIWRQISKR